MFRKIAITAVAALTLSMGMAQAAGDGGHVHDTDFPWEGPFGKFDQFQLQRGLQVYTEVCSACHGLKFVPIRALADPGGPQLPADQVRAYAASLDAVVLPDGTERPREWTDKFPARVGEGMGPDLSLMAKARAGFHGPYGTGINQLFKGIGGPEYITALLTGYTGEEVEEAGSFFYLNTVFPGGKIAMSPPLSDGQVEFADGHDNSVHHMAEDVSAFLMWAAEPHMMARKQSGFMAVTILALLTVLLYLTNKKLWARVKGKTFDA
jgi:ubiquinol-cytochrome c reductase cytochrome c1 subunit